VPGGITKVNIGTALNVTMTTAVRADLATERGPRTYLVRGREAMAAIVTHFITVLNGKASAPAG
jgi:fructose-bisphosphate aldolase class II